PPPRPAGDGRSKKAEIAECACARSGAPELRVCACPALSQGPGNRFSAQAPRETPPPRPSPGVLRGQWTSARVCRAGYVSSYLRPCWRLGFFLEPVSGQASDWSAGDPEL
ncbi:hypothetical protein H1C71_011342, partial [Ictidomys tridecemlineatus]